MAPVKLECLTGHFQSVGRHAAPPGVMICLRGAQLLHEAGECSGRMDFPSLTAWRRRGQHRLWTVAVVVKGDVAWIRLLWF